MSTFRTALASSVAGAALLAASALPTHSAEMKPVLTLDAANAMVQGCLTLAAENGWAMHVTVLDDGANLKAYARMDNSMLLAQDISMGKARTSAMFPGPTSMLGQMAFGEGTPNPFAFIPGVIYFAGGLPVMSGGAHVGGIGVSGAQADEDEQCAQAGIDAAAAAGLL
jgi:glc operon protein GlcG